MRLPIRTYASSCAIIGLVIYLFSFATRAGSPQQREPVTACRPVLPNPPCQLSLWEETGVPGKNPRLSAKR